MDCHCSGHFWKDILFEQMESGPWRMPECLGLSHSPMRIMWVLYRALWETQSSLSPEEIDLACKLLENKVFNKIHREAERKDE